MGVISAAVETARERYRGDRETNSWLQAKLQCKHWETRATEGRRFRSIQPTQHRIPIQQSLAIVKVPDTYLALQGSISIDQVLCSKSNTSLKITLNTGNLMKKITWKQYFLWKKILYVRKGLGTSSTRNTLYFVIDVYFRTLPNRSNFVNVIRFWNSRKNIIFLINYVINYVLQTKIRNINIM